ncbi:hypothetical protein [Burkholderia pyrrocinia]|uniref:hypothetical protein n=1 Tax=Burkholderia pyrrocinia TaxID=60550 RepID=UPI001ABBDE7F|nr:hypothetical protein [Burkholderia pyrrocinia]
MKSGREASRHSGGRFRRGTNNDLNYAYRRLAGCGAGRAVFRRQAAESHVSVNRSGFRSCRLASRADQENAGWKMPEMTKSRIYRLIGMRIREIKSASVDSKKRSEPVIFAGSAGRSAKE